MMPTAAPDPSAEVHIAGILVQARSADGARIADAVRALPGLEVPSVADGRLVIVAECANAREIVDRIDRIRALQGVLNVALVYQHAESLGAMEEEMSDETDPPGVH
ncbi:MAG: chaperone NapD [Aromatoleum sp.]|jgi:nitrate reductase NapD|uniref:chaperone NapD n=1 Tax=Aromatoleum sp. TaxID=2307007 RepID=UPI00289562AD|nr:chaperone NapD [Aromatoleum sp.]MDT3672748.1 chaperone NapD [Aromatoleum sp.]